MFSLRAVSRVAGVRSFANTSVRFFKRPLNGYGAFLKATKGDAGLKRLTVAKRGAAAGKRWWALSAAEREAFVQKGKKIIVQVPARKSRWVRVRASSAYNKFVKKNFHKVAKLPVKQRLAAIAKLYKK